LFFDLTTCGEFERSRFTLLRRSFLGLASFFTSFGSGVLLLFFVFLGVGLGDGVREADELLLELSESELELEAALCRLVCSRATITDFVPRISFTVSSAALKGLKAGVGTVFLGGASGEWAGDWDRELRLNLVSSVRFLLALDGDR